MSKTKLLPCPFCGGEAKVATCDWLFSVRDYWIYCRSCDCSSGRYHSKDQAIKAWNKRKPMDYIVEQLEEKSYDSMHLDMSTPMTETWQIIDLKDAIHIVRNAEKDGAE